MAEEDQVEELVGGRHSQEAVEPIVELVPVAQDVGHVRGATWLRRMAITLDKATLTRAGMIEADTLKEGDGMGEAERIDLNALAAGLPPYRLAEAADFIEWLKAKEERELPPILRDAPIDDEPITPEVLAAIDAAKADTVTYSAEEMRQRYGLA